MSIQSILGQSIDIAIDGKKAKLHPLSLYEIGTLEGRYVAFCRRQTIDSTRGLPQGERVAALNEEAVHIAALDTDCTPVIDWVCGSHEGLCMALSACIETADGADVSPRIVGRWYMDSGRDDVGSPTHRWMIASHLRPDPTEPVATTGNSENNENNENNEAADNG